ncbi:MAG: DUF1592 domain-containing protein, partial [Planctomycetales bacterium]|nr:DUF1592 domain-containing protein [Planctomycetales bacterium]
MRTFPHLSLFCMTVAVWCADTRAWATEAPAHVREIMGQVCVGCHHGKTAEGGLDLAQVAWSFDDPELRRQWVAIHDRVAAGEMPPDAAELPAVDRQRLVASLASAILEAERKETRESGRGPLRRLTRREYEQNLRDLLKLPDLDVADRLPADRDAHGFTKVAGLLDVSRVQLAGYLDAAAGALHEAVASGVSPPEQKHFRFVGTDLFPELATFGEREAMFFTRDGKMVAISGSEFAKMTPEQRRDPTLELALFRSATWPYYGYPRGFRAPRDGRYQVKFSARSVRQLPGFRTVPGYAPLAMSFRARQPSGADVSGDVRETGGLIDLLPEAREFETSILLKRGETFEYSLLGLPVPFIRTDGGFFYDFPPMPRDGHRGAAFQWLEVTGPISPAKWPPESHRVSFGDLPIRAAASGGALAVEVVSSKPQEDAERLFRRFARAVARRPLSEDSHAQFLRLIHAKLNEGAPFAEAMLKGYQAFLCSGHFLYLTEPRGDEYALASRLSHFLWNSRPDEPLLQLAAEGRLRSQLRSEVDRLISDERFERFVADFTDQWLGLAQLRRDNPDVRLYPEYRKDDYLVDSMGRETRSFFTAMVRENLPIATVVDADFAFVNDRLAEHYGLSRQSGSAMRRVELPQWSPYGGLLTQASVLKLTSNGTTTSPVVRGAWVMEKLLGKPPPPPPKTVPAIAPDIRGVSTIRELLAKHTESPTCAACHAKFDPVGFALENF